MLSYYPIACFPQTWEHGFGVFLLSALQSSLTFQGLLLDHVFFGAYLVAPSSDARSE